MIDKRERTSGKDRREKKDESETDTKGLRGVSVIGLRGKTDAKDKKGRKEGRGRSERVGVQDSRRGGEGRAYFEYRSLERNTPN